MKTIIYTTDAGMLAVLAPTEGARCAICVTLTDGTRITGDAAPVDTFLRRWPVEGATVEWAESEDDFVARIAAKDVPADAANVQIVDASAIPTDRTFRNAWKAVAGRVEHDMDKAREIQKERLRELRAPLLADLDVQYMRALESEDGAAQKRIAAEKQELRDVTDDPAIAAASTPEQLKAVMPDALA